MTCVVGIDIGTTSTIGMLIRPPGEVLALVSRPVALRSPHGSDGTSPSNASPRPCRSAALPS